MYVNNEAANVIGVTDIREEYIPQKAERKRWERERQEREKEREPTGSLDVSLFLKGLSRAVKRPLAM